MTIHFIYIIIICRYLRSTLKSDEKLVKWNTVLVNATYISIAVLALGWWFSSLQTILLWIGQIVLIIIAWLFYTEPEFKKSRLILIAILPYVIVTLIANLTKLFSTSFYNEWNSVFENAVSFSILWSFGTWLMIRNQGKELEKMRQKALEDEERNRTISAMNDQLEKQVAQRTAEITRQKEDLELALTELKSTQAQLIQSEKMASLGELTAGIAHEIQNPLNFVNNFSEVSAELLSEMKQELKNGNAAEVDAIAADIEKNLERITQHGKRADAIVKSMLQHSRKNTGQLEPTNINELADEYLRLSYHGLRAKDKSFNATMQTDFDETLTPINMVPQDVGRVLLNLFNNAFYAVNEKKMAGTESYKPTLSVTTKKKEGYVEIQVTDNGNGIPQSVIDKIFQPFFSTKPTGQGTGLGLSLSYDIIVRQHGGSIKAETKENEGTTFIISLPIK